MLKYLRYRESKRREERTPLTREATLEYIDKNDSFRVTDKRDLIQYATFYFKRLTILREYVVNECKRRWKRKDIPEEEDDMDFLNNILDIRPGEVTVIIGTLYKEMPKKPCILSNLVGVLREDRKRSVNYCTPEDYLVLEDSSGRIRIKNQSLNCVIDPNLFITGSIMGFKGFVDQNGFFDVEDCCYAGLNPDHFTPLPEHSTLNLNEDDDAADDDRDLIAFVSGLEFGATGFDSSIQLLKRFLRGECGE